MLGEKGHRLLLHGRDESKLKQAATSVSEEARTYLADFSKPDEVMAMAAALLADYDRIDILINNAGVLKAPVTQAPTGRDIRFEVNTLAPYALTCALLPVIPKTGRIVNLSSAAQAPVDVDAMVNFRTMRDFDAYAQSKLANTIWSAELARDLGDGPLVVAVNPGSLLASKMVKDSFGVAGNDLSIGADILVRAALSDEFAGASGTYFDNDAGQFAPPHPAASDPSHVRTVMQTIRRLCRADYGL